MCAKKIDSANVTACVKHIGNYLRYLFFHASLQLYRDSLCLAQDNFVNCEKNKKGR